MASHLKPTDINKQLFTVLNEIQHKHEDNKFLFFDKKSIILAGAATFGAIGLAVFLPPAAVLAVPILGKIGVASFVGSIAIGAYRNFKNSKNIEDTVSDFCERVGVDKNKYKSSIDTYGYNSALMNAVIKESYFTNEAVVDFVEKANATPKTQEQKPAEDLTDKISSSKESFFYKVGKTLRTAHDTFSNAFANDPKNKAENTGYSIGFNIAEKIKNSKNAFLEGFKEATNENEKKNLPKIR